MKKILITGGTGFIGSNLAAALVSLGYSVRILRRASSDLFNLRSLEVEHRVGDVRDPESLRRAMHGCDTVFHTAAMVSFWRPLRPHQHEVNVLGTRNVVDACFSEHVERLVYTSSIAAIGHPTNGELATELTPFNWQDADNGYKNSKYLAEKEIASGLGRGLDAVMVNPALVIGPGDIHFNGGKILKTVVKRQALFYIKGGANIVFVGDVVKGHVAAALSGRKGEKYILGGENLTHKEIFQVTAEIVGGVVPRMKMPVPLLRLAARTFDVAGSIINKEPLITSEMISGAGLFNWYSSGKAQRELGYTITPFRDAVAATYDWYVRHNLL